jgi:hypothetical protein
MAATVTRWPRKKAPISTWEGKTLRSREAPQTREGKLKINSNPGTATNLCPK